MILAPDLAAALDEAERSFEGIMALDGVLHRQRENRRTLRFERAGRGYVVKQHRGIGWREIAKNLVSGRLPVVSARNEWVAMNRLRAAGVPVPRPVAMGSRGWNPARRQSFVIAESLDHTVALDGAAVRARVLRDPVEKRRLIAAIADIARRMHDAGINHRDFYLCHFLFDGETGRLYLIDLHRAQHRRRVPWRWRVKDLAGLYFSALDLGLTRRDLLRFVIGYRRAALRQILQHESAFWATVAARAAALYRKEHGRLPGAPALRPAGG